MKTAIIVLASLLALSLVALGATLLYNKLADSPPATVTVPDNLITPEEETPAPNSDSNKSPAQPSENAGSAAADTPRTSPSAASQTAAAIELYNKRTEDNVTFQVGNMFPGDVITKYYRVNVSYHDKITVHYKAAVRSGYEKLAEVLKVRVKLLTTGETLYDGLMGEMPRSVTHKLSAAQSTTDELYYEITAYLDTSVGNAYQNKNLIADFQWWVEEHGNLDDNPTTGDTALLLWTSLAALSGCVLIFLLFARRRKEEETNG